MDFCGVVMSIENAEWMDGLAAAVGSDTCAARDWGSCRPENGCLMQSRCQLQEQYMVRSLSPSCLACRSVSLWNRQLS
jgi:hypothetical protein